MQIYFNLKQILLAIIFRFIKIYILFTIYVRQLKTITKFIIMRNEFLYRNSLRFVSNAFIYLYQNYLLPVQSINNSIEYLSAINKNLIWHVRIDAIKAKSSDTQHNMNKKKQIC